MQVKTNIQRQRRERDLHLRELLELDKHSRSLSKQMKSIEREI